MTDKAENLHCRAIAKLRVHPLEFVEVFLKYLHRLLILGQFHLGGFLHKALSHAGGSPVYTIAVYLLHLGQEPCHLFTRNLEFYDVRPIQHFRREQICRLIYVYCADDKKVFRKCYLLRNVVNRLHFDHALP